MSGIEWLDVPEVAHIIRRSVRTVHDLTRTREIPHRVLSNRRGILVRRDELDAWLDGAGSDLEVIERPNGGRIVRPIDTEKSPV